MRDGLDDDCFPRKNIQHDAWILSTDGQPILKSKWGNWLRSQVTLKDISLKYIFG